jgi:hypothetical protein
MKQRVLILLSIVLVLVFAALLNAQITIVSGRYTAPLAFEICSAAFALGCLTCAVVAGAVSRWGWLVGALLALTSLAAMSDGMSRLLPAGS